MKEPFAKSPTPVDPNDNLDPKDWETMRATMHQMVDDAVDYLANVRERPLWQAMPEEVQKHFDTSVPRQASDLEAVYRDFQSNILPYNLGTVHPKFWAWYMGNGTMTGALGDFWASVMNPNLGGANHAANLVEEQVLQWMKEILGFPKSASGLLVSGGSMANFVGLSVARNNKAGYNIRQSGLQDKRMMVYASTEVHSCNQKALELLGMGEKSLRKIPVNAQYEMDLVALQKQIAEDEAAGLQPIAIIATSGTVNTGAIDDLEAIADICSAKNLWFHIDGAIGGVAVLAENVRPLLQGISRADSIAIDLHKWMHMPFEAGCILVKDAAAHKNTFSLIPEYLAQKSEGIAAGRLWFSEYGPQLSRRFRALKIWMSIKEQGIERFGEMIAKNVVQANYLAQLVAEHADLELTAPVSLDIVCFRYNPGGLSTVQLQAINEAAKLKLEKTGFAAPGYTTLQGQYCIRVAISNHRSTLEDFDAFVERFVQYAAEQLGKVATE